MKKVFLYLYPIKEYTEMFLFHDDKLYDEWNVKRPMPIINECIQKRYRDKGYEVVFATYPDKEIFGIDLKSKDKIIYTDVLFQEASSVDENKNIKKDFIPKYPDEEFLLAQLGNVTELIVGGYHAQDCVRRVVESALDNCIDAIIDLDLTDFFFNLYRQEEYFEIEKYSPARYKQLMINKSKKYGEEFAERHFLENYNSPAYGFNGKSAKIK